MQTLILNAIHSKYARKTDDISAPDRFAMCNAIEKHRRALNADALRYLK